MTKILVPGTRWQGAGRAGRRGGRKGRTVRVGQGRDGREQGTGGDLGLGGELGGPVQDGRRVKIVPV